jgi:citrate lyase synthetase
MIIYTLENNAYGIIKDIDTEIPIHVYVYENNNRMIAEGEFYFEKSIKFLAIPDAYYSVRFRNGGQPKLVSFTYPNIL